MRTFLAIEIPEHIKKNIGDTLSEFRLKYRNLNWIPQENYHITLYFFGDVPENKIKPLGQRIEECLFERKSFDISLKSGHIFIKNSIVLYITLFRQKEMEHIVKDIQADLGIQKPRPFIPHISIARYKIPSKQQYLLLKKKFGALSFDEEFHVDTIYLYKSVLKRPHAEYTQIQSFSLI